MTPIERMRRMVMGAGKGAASARAQAATKSSAVGGLGRGTETWLMGPGAASWTSRRYDRFAEEGYRKNVIAYRSVRLIAEGGASIPWLLYEGEREVTAHPLLQLLKRPNPMADGASFLEAAYGFLLIAGNSYIEAVETSRGQPGELYALRPDRMKVIPGAKGWPRGYQYSVAGQSHLFEHDPARGLTPILHLKSFHPLDDHYGLSAFEPAAFGVDLHNESSAWNKALLDNAARPSGALVYNPGEAGASLTQDQFDRLKAEMEEQFQGGGNAGRPLLLEGGLSWQQLGFSPADMDFINAKHVSAREIALAFGVPPMLLGIPGDNTYANYAEANRALWRQTILPMARKLTAALNAWLAPKFGEGLRLDINTDAIEALAADRAQTWAQVGAATFLTTNEKRAALGYGPIEGGDKLQAASFPFVTGRPNLKGVRGDREQRYRTLYREYVKAEIGGMKYKIWRTAEDGDVRETHRQVDGIAVPINDKFRVGGERLFLPSDPSVSLDETANCRCTADYVDELPSEVQQRIVDCTAIAAEIGNAQLQIESYHQEMLQQAAIIEDEVGRLQREIAADENGSLIDAVLGAVGALLETTPSGAFVNVAVTLVSKVNDLLEQGRKIEKSRRDVVAPAAKRIDFLTREIEALEQDVLSLRQQQQQLGCQIL